MIYALIAIALFIAITYIYGRHQFEFVYYAEEYKTSMIEYKELFTSGEFMEYAKSGLEDDIPFKERIILAFWLVVILCSPILLFIKYLLCFVRDILKK